MNDRPRSSRVVPGQRRHVLLMAVSGLSLVVALALLGLLLRLVG
jgi:hypothetical protein